jgi:feruloyl esterase
MKNFSTSLSFGIAGLVIASLLGCAAPPQAPTAAPAVPTPQQAKPAAPADTAKPAAPADVPKPAAPTQVPLPTTVPTGLAKLAPIKPVMDCAAVRQLDLNGVTDGEITIKSATVIVTGTVAPYCEVRGTISPANTIVVRLPTEGWTQRYVQTGCGGLCGTSNIGFGKGSECAVIRDGSTAVATTDMGHQGQNDGSWGKDNPQAQIDFAYRGVHVTAQAAKAIITKFYGKAPAYSYFNGCSDGGREALMEAQRYPEDFNGIVAGAPANNMSVQNTVHHAWNVLANKDAEGKPILMASKLPMIHKAVLAACDKLDGLDDGIIDDPRMCQFEPKTLVCKAGQDAATCLSDAEASVVQKLHDGARDEKGQYLEPKIAHHWGSELDWALFVPATMTQTVASVNFALSYLRYLAYFNTAMPNYQLNEFKFNVPAFWEAMQTSVYMAALDPDLSAFEKRGGKLLLWHGINDHHISSQNTLAYYDAMRNTMGADKVGKFTKLYLFPGVTHCGGGEGPDNFDVLTPTMAWVESNIVPDKIVASKFSGTNATRTRPVYPYPMVARYNGSGSIDDAANFSPFKPTQADPPAGADYEWVGKILFTSGYQTTCKAEGTKLVCAPAKVQLPTGK